MRIKMTADELAKAKLEQFTQQLKDGIEHIVSDTTTNKSEGDVLRAFLVGCSEAIELPNDEAGMKEWIADLEHDAAPFMDGYSACLRSQGKML